MGSRIMQVFYGNDCLPYKDSARSVHYPIVGNSFVNSSNVSQFRFYTRDIGGVNTLSWVANVKLPNGNILYQLLPTYHLDEELNEYYVEFDLSSYYTQLKGDIYISLNGCQGQVEITHDDETNLDEISGYIDSRTVVVTGAIKFTINYAPNRPSGYSFNLDQYETIIDGLSNKANVINTIQVITDISTADLSGFATGQLFYDLETQLYYKKIETSPYYELADYGVLGSENLLFRSYITSGTTISDLQDVSGNYTRYLLVNLSNADYLICIIQNQDLTCRVNAFDLNTREYWYKDNVLSSVTLSSLFVDDNKVKYIRKGDSTSAVYANDDSGNETMVPYSNNVENDKIVQRKSNAQIAVPIKPLANDDATSKKYVDDLIVTIQENELQVVSELPDTGEEGIIYLVPIDEDDLTKGYYRYIWESNAWLSLGTTEIDLSDYYTKTQADTKFVPYSGATTYVNLGSNELRTTGNVRVGRLNIRPSSSSTNTRLNFDNSSTATKGYIEVASDGSHLRIYCSDNGGYQIYKNGSWREIATEYYVTNALTSKVDKLSSANKVYITDDTGAQDSASYDDYATGSFVRRNDSGGQIYVPATPTANTHATSKKYVDDSISSAIASVYRIKGSKTVAQLNAMTSADLTIGDVYNLLDSGTLTAGNIDVFIGDNVVWTGSAWDKLGTEIDWSAYDEKFIAAGFFEVQPYNESTGEITFVYSSELYIMSYDGDTGVMTIEAN